MKMTLQTRNARGIVANLHAADRRVQREIRKVVRAAGVRTHELAYERAPVDTGFMRSQLRLRFSDEGLVYDVGFEEADFTAAGLPFYPLYVIFGTVRMPARDFLFTTHEEVRQAFRRDLSAAIRRSIARRAA